MNLEFMNYGYFSDRLKIRNLVMFIHNHIYIFFSVLRITPPSLRLGVLYIYIYDDSA